MKFNKTIIAILAIFMVMMSASAVFADDVLSDGEGTSDGDQNPVTPITNDGNGDTDVKENDGTSDGQGEDEGNDGAPAESENTEEGPEVTTATDGNNEETSDAQANATNSTANSTADITNQPVSDYATGNPIIVLLLVLAVLGIYPLKR